MPETTQSTHVPDTKTVLLFIEKYREFEKMPYDIGYIVISNICPKHQYPHLCNHWHGKKKHFGNFFLNLDTKTQINLLRFWGIADANDDHYLHQCSVDRLYHFFAENKPKTVSFLHEMIKYFNNHGIYEGSFKSQELTILPPKNKRYGNAANWGDYIFSLKEPQIVIDLLAKHQDKPVNFI